VANTLLRPQSRTAVTTAVPSTGPAHRPSKVAKLAAGGADAVTIALAMLAAWILRPVLPYAAPANAHIQHFVIAMLSLPLWLGVFAHYRLYSARRIATRLEEFRRIVHAVGASVLAMAVAAFMLKLYVARGWLILTFAFGLAGIVVEREILRRVFNALRRRGRMLRPVVVVGANAEGFALVHELTTDPSLGYAVVGVVDNDAVAADTLLPHRVATGTFDQTLDAVRRSGATGVIIATTAVDFETSNRLARDLTESGIHVELSNSLRDIHVERLTPRQLGRFPVTYVEPVARHGWRHVAKRALDLAVSLGGLLAASPVLLACAVLVKLESRGPVFFKQERVGQNGKLFKVLKFRTMVVNAEALLIDLRDQNEADGPLFKMKDDPRITRVGKILRKLSIDEIPQLWNVVRNEMSLVGPRPALMREVADWTPELHNRLRVKPGITGMWQVMGRSDSSFESYARHDLFYVDNWSLWTDLAIVGKTIPTVLFGKGAY
jgi:exopolysaccharide biosynthesis polyprenyl glycosylphosphotransferase